jgi:hypothetical protein
VHIKMKRFPRKQVRFMSHKLWKILQSCSQRRAKVYGCAWFLC